MPSQSLSMSMSDYRGRADLLCPYPMAESCQKPTKCTDAQQQGQSESASIGVAVRKAIGMNSPFVGIGDC
jgi:hypothetical protein